jgi:hypothetical protein
VFYFEVGFIAVVEIMEKLFCMVYSPFSVSLHGICSTLRCVHKKNFFISICNVVFVRRPNARAQAMIRRVSVMTRGPT